MNVKPLPKWLMRKYAVLWKEFGEDDFTCEDARKLIGDKEEVFNVVISDMKKSGYIKVSIDSEDKRKRLYRIISPDNMIKNLEVQKSE